MFEGNAVTGWTGPKLWHHPDVFPMPAKMTTVWVQLDVICSRSPDALRHVITAGLDMSGKVRGLLSAWHRSIDGDWLGIVNFSVPYADGRPKKLFLRDHLVPAYALSRRDDNWPI